MEIEGTLTTHRETTAEKINNCYISVADIKETTQQRKLLMI
jgi:hypothetical protein